MSVLSCQRTFITPMSSPRPVVDFKIPLRRLVCQYNILKNQSLTIKILCDISYITAVRRAVPRRYAAKIPRLFAGAFLFVLHSFPRVIIDPLY